MDLVVSGGPDPGRGTPARGPVVADTTRGELGGGLRVIGVAELENIVGIQAGYTGVFRGGAYAHSVHASVSLDFLGLAVLYIAGKAG